MASYLHLLCTHYPSSPKKSGVSHMGWIWPIIFIPTEVPTEFYMVSNITKALKVKQTGGLLLKAKRPQLYKHVMADNMHRKCKTCMGREQASIHQIFMFNISSQSHAWYMKFCTDIFPPLLHLLWEWEMENIAPKKAHKTEHWILIITENHLISWEYLQCYKKTEDTQKCNVVSYNNFPEAKLKKCWIFCWKLVLSCTPRNLWTSRFYLCRICMPHVSYWMILGSSEENLKLYSGNDF